MLSSIFKKQPSRKNIDKCVLSVLPFDMKVRILSYLSVSELCCTARVSKEFKSVSLCDKIWSKLLHSILTSPLTSSGGVLIGAYYKYVDTYNAKFPQLKKGHKPIKVTYKKLVEKGVIKSSLVPKMGQISLTFTISAAERGLFFVNVALMGKSVDFFELEWDRLQNLLHAYPPTHELENFTLSVSGTMLFLNRHFHKTRLPKDIIL